MGKISSRQTSLEMSPWARRGLGEEGAASCAITKETGYGDGQARNGGSTVSGGVEGDVDDGFELDGEALLGGGAELPLAEGLHGVGVEIWVNTAH